MARVVPAHVKEGETRETRMQFEDDYEGKTNVLFSRTMRVMKWKL